MRLLLFLVLMSFSAQAQFIKELCQNKTLNLHYVGHLITNESTIWNYQGETLLEVPEGFLGLAVGSNSYWMLKQDHLREVSLTGELMAEYPLPYLSTSGWGKKLISFAGRLYVLHDSGVSAFNLETKAFLWSEQITHLEDTKTVDLTTDGNALYVVMASQTETAFVGIVMLSTQGKLEKDLRLKPSYGVFAPNARAHWNSNKLFINNAGWMLMIDQKQLAGTKALTPKLLPTPLMVNGIRKQAMLMGDFTVDEGTFSGCASVGQIIDGRGVTLYDHYTFKL